MSQLEVREQARTVQRARDRGRYKFPKLQVRVERERPSCTLSGPADAVGAVRAVTCDVDPMVERFAVLFVDGRNRLIGGSVVALGGRHGLAITAVEILRPAIVAAATAIILGHNHPSGDPTPSPEDRAMTARVAKAAAVVGIPVVDHVIVTEDGAHSMCEAGEL